MKYNILTAITIMLLSMAATAQNRADLEEAQRARAGLTTRSQRTQKIELTRSEDEPANLYYFYIPSAIMFASLEPAASSNLSLDFGDDKITLKLGYPTKEDEEDKGAPMTSFAIKGSASAPDGARTVFSYDDTPRDLTAGVVTTFLLADTLFSTTVANRTFNVKRKASWININLDYSNVKRNIFADDINFSSKHYHNVSLMVTYNHYYNGWYGDLKKKRHTLSAGLGIASYDNYADLPNHTLRTGRSDAANQYFIETDATSGRLGVYERTFGLQVSGAAFVPLTPPAAKITVMPGLNVNYYGAFSSNELLNGNLGLYFAFKSYDDETDELNEDFSFGLVADFNNLNDVSEDDYAKNNFGIILTAQIPIRFQ